MAYYGFNQILYSSTILQDPQDDQLAITLDDLAYRSLLLGFGFLPAPQDEFLSVGQTVKPDETQQRLHYTLQSMM